MQCGAPCSSPRKCSRNFLQETIFMTILQKTITRGIMFKFVSSSFLFLITSKKKEDLCNRPQKSCEKRPPRWGAAAPYSAWGDDVYLRQVLQRFAAP